ncbi:hypothetical protein [Labilibaculum euxinus]
MSKKGKRKTPVVKYNESAAVNVNFNRIKQVCQLLGCADALGIISQQEMKEIYRLRMHFMEPKLMAGHKISREKMRIYKHFCQLFCQQEKSVLVEGQKPVSVIAMVAVERFIAWHSYVPETRSTEIKKALHVLRYRAPPVYIATNPYRKDKLICTLPVVKKYSTPGSCLNWNILKSKCWNWLIGSLKVKLQ